MNNGLLHCVYEISGGKEEPDALNGDVEIGKRNRGAGEKNKREPEELIENLSLLHGIGDAGDDQAQRSEGNRANAYEDKNAEEVTPRADMENEARQYEFSNDRGESEGEVGHDAGGEHVASGNWRDVKAAEDTLLPEHNQRSAEAPKTSHDVTSENRAEIKSTKARIAFGEDAQPEEEEAERHHDAKEEEHFVAQGQADAHACQGGEVRQSRSLLPVSSMKTSSSEGVAISKLTSSLPRASRCLTRETMACGGRLE